MEEHLDYIIDPDDTVKRYLSSKWLLKVYLCVCFFAELCLILGITIKYKGSITLAVSQQNDVNKDLNIIFFMLNFVISTVSTCYGLRTLSSNSKKTFWNYQIILILNINTEVVVSIFFVANVAVLILRTLLLVGVLYLV